MSLDDCRQIVDEFEPSPARRAVCQLSPEGFSRFFMFSDMVNVVDVAKMESVYQVQNAGLCFPFHFAFFYSWNILKYCIRI